MTRPLADSLLRGRAWQQPLDAAGQGAAEWAWIVPFGLVLYYPWALQLFHDSVTRGHPFGSMSLVYIGTAYLVPFVIFCILCGLSRRPTMTDRIVLARQLCHLAFAAPPAFTLMGVMLALMRINGHDIAAWTGAWTILAVLGALIAGTTPPRATAIDDPRVYGAVRVAHGISALLILASFLAPHLFNHMFGVFGAGTHKAIMKILRVVYRQHVVEPILIATFCFQLLSGLVLLRPRTFRRADTLDCLQTASGAYLLFFVASHVNSVFILARYFGTETDYAWATGQPAGLIKDGWNIRLVPHYSLAVFLLLGHLACALRVVLRHHGVEDARSNRIAGSVVLAGSLATLVITAGMLGLRLGHAGT